MDEARSAVKAGLALNPSFTISLARAVWRTASDDPTYLAQFDTILEGMRMAGIPSHDRDPRFAAIMEIYVVGYYRFIVEEKASKKRGRP